jgi:TPR repeat protein
MNRRRITALLTASLAILGMAAPAQAGVKEGVDAWQRGDYATAVDQWRAPAIAGDADAQFNLGQAYRLGRGVETDFKLAEGWYAKAAQQGHAQAAANYGLILFQNGDHATAMPWLEKSAERGDPRALYVFGTALFNGDTVAKNWVRAYAMMTRAAAAGLTQAKPSLVEMDKYLSPQQREQALAQARTLAGNQEMVSNWAPATPPEATKPSTQSAEQVAPSKTEALSETKSDAAARPAKRPAKPVVTKPPVTKAARVAPPVPTTAATAAIPNGQSWRVQLGVFPNADEAKGEWKRIKPKISGLAALQPLIIPVGKIVRLRAGPIHSQQEADRICRHAQAAKIPCLALRD